MSSLRPVRSAEASDGDSSMVVCIANHCRPGYSQTFIASHLERLPFRNLLLYGAPLPSYDGRDRNLLGKLSFLRYVHRLWPDLFGLRAERIYERFHALAVARYLRQARARVVLAEFGWTAVGMIGPCRAARVPLVAHFHGNDAYQAEVLEAQAAGYRELFPFASAVVAVSSDMERQLVELGAPAEKIRRIVYGVDVELFSGADPARSPPVLLAVGRFVEKKAPHLTLLAFTKALARAPDARLAMIGDGALLGPCRAIAEGLGIADRVEFLGVLEPAAVARAMAGARAYVQHSMRAADGDSEGTPVSILEAQASGLPVVATRHAGIGEVVIDGVTGRLVAERDVDAMAEGMLEVLHGPAVAAAWGAAGRARVREHFRSEQSIGRLADVLREAAATPPR